jgi:hypothetical protein
VTADFRLTAYAAARAPERPRRRGNPVSVIRVLPAVWEHALRLADGDAGRIRIISASAVLVVNNRRQ